MGPPELSAFDFFHNIFPHLAHNYLRILIPPTFLYRAVSSGASRVFGWFANMTSVAGMLNWICLCITAIRCVFPASVSRFGLVVFSFLHSRVMLMVISGVFVWIGFAEASRYVIFLILEHMQKTPHNTGPRSSPIHPAIQKPLSAICGVVWALVGIIRVLLLCSLSSPKMSPFTHYYTPDLTIVSFRSFTAGPS